uniref:hypothetical protein n=1 Tax=Sphingomonas bacterium TaxID=1895847 RepID=UPI0026127A42|nr:hypothetical protein [Sphingomonas bacterium]
MIDALLPPCAAGERLVLRKLKSATKGSKWGGSCPAAFRPLFADRLSGALIGPAAPERGKVEEAAPDPRSPIRLAAERMALAVQPPPSAASKKVIPMASVTVM